MRAYVLVVKLVGECRYFWDFWTPIVKPGRFPEQNVEKAMCSLLCTFVSRNLTRYEHGRLRTILAFASVFCVRRFVGTTKQFSMPEQMSSFAGTTIMCDIETDWFLLVSRRKGQFRGMLMVLTIFTGTRTSTSMS